MTSDTQCDECENEFPAGDLQAIEVFWGLICKGCETSLARQYMVELGQGTGVAPELPEDAQTVATGAGALSKIGFHDGKIVIAVDGAGVIGLTPEDCIVSAGLLMVAGMRAMGVGEAEAYTINRAALSIIGEHADPEGPGADLVAFAEAADDMDADRDDELELAGAAKADELVGDDQADGTHGFESEITSSEGSRCEEAPEQHHSDTYPRGPAGPVWKDGDDPGPGEAKSDEPAKNEPGDDDEFEDSETEAASMGRFFEGMRSPIGGGS